MASFKQKPKSTIKQRKAPKMSYVWFWMHCLAVYATKSVKDQFTETCSLPSRDLTKGAKIVFKLLFLTYGHVLRKKTKSTIKQRGTSEKPNICFWVHWLADDAQRSVY